MGDLCDMEIYFLDIYIIIGKNYDSFIICIVLGVNQMIQIQC